MKMKLNRLALFGLDLLFPPRCMFCGEIIAPGTKICQECAKSIVPSGTVHCIQIPVKKKEISCAFLYSYEGRVRDSIIQYKFHGQKQYAGFYAQELAKQVNNIFPETEFDFITSVPLSDERKKERGYNQSELIAKPIAEALHLPYLVCLQKIKANGVQHLMNREQRANNVRGAYSLSGESVKEKKILLIDDIVTTGATLAECASVLFEGGAGDVSCAAIARVAPEEVEKS